METIETMQINELILSVEMIRICNIKISLLDYDNGDAIKKIEDALTRIEEVIKEHMPEYVPQDINKHLCKK